MAQQPANNNGPTSTPSRSKLLSTGFKDFVNRHALAHPQKALTVQLHNAEVRANMSTSASGFPETSDAPGEEIEPRQTATSEDYTPDPSKSLQPSPARQRLVDDVCTTCLRNQLRMLMRSQKAAKEHVRKYGTGSEEGVAKKDFTN